MLVSIAAGDKYVGRLDVPVNESTSVSGIQSASNLDSDRNRALQRQAPLLPDHSRQVVSFDVLHHDIEEAAIFPSVIDRDDVGVFYRSRDLRLASEACPEAIVIGQLRGHDFECPLLAENHVPYAIYDAHTPTTG
jgi:hypothetical protein